MKIKLKDLREDNDLFQKDIAKVLNVTERQYRRFENHEQELSYNKLITLSKFYNVSIDYILNITYQRKPYKRIESDINIKNLRKDKKLTQVYLSKFLNISQQQYSRVELNKNELSYDQLIKLAEFYNVSIDYILGLTNEKKAYPNNKRID